MNTSEPLVCPSCALTHTLDERFCRNCGMPLVYAGSAGVDMPVTATHERARKVKKQYLEGDLVYVASAKHQAEAELIQGFLLEEGIPSMVRRSRGFDVPDMLAAGPRDVLVPESAVAPAREVLMQADLLPDQSSSGIDGPARVAVGLLGAVGLVALILWIGTQLIN